jgi:hypothetical protein
MRNVPSVCAGVDTLVQFCQETNGFFSTIETDAGGSVEEKIVPRISRRDDTVVEKSDVADPREHEIFQDRSCSGTGTNDENVRRFQSRLSRRSPEPTNVIKFRFQEDMERSIPKLSIISTGFVVRPDPRQK